MIGLIAIPIVLLAATEGPDVNSAQFAEIVKERSGPLKSVVFVYEGGRHWIGPLNLGTTPDKFDEDFQGTYLYRADGAAAMDVYIRKPDPTSSVVRRKKSVLKGKTERVRGLLDAKTPLDPARDIQFGEGSVASLNGTDAPQELFWTWYWSEQGDLSRRNYNFQGWEMIDGHNCLRFQIETYAGGNRGDRDYQRFWVDVERNAHVVRTEVYEGGKLTTNIDIRLSEFLLPDGKRIWFPTRCHTKWHVWGNSTYTEPVSERTLNLVNGSTRINIDLPDSLFTVRRDTALPQVGELEKIEGTSRSNALRREFEAQPARKPFRTDPAGIREGIDKNLAEADRQSRELEASSPARASWSWASAFQIAFAIVGVALLVGIAYRKWKAR